MVANIIRSSKGRKNGKNTILALENHGHLVNDAPTLVEILQAVNDDHLRLTLDTGNFCWAGRSLEEAAAYFKELAPYVVNVHLKDLVFTGPAKVQFLPLGEGDLDLKKVIQELATVGYNDSALREYEGMGEPKEH